MDAIRMDEIPLRTTEFGVRVRALLDTDAFKVMNLVIEPGQAVPPHQSPVAAFFYVAGGEGEITIGGEVHRVRATDILPCPAGVTMRLRATAGTFRVLNVKAPNPATLA